MANNRIGVTVSLYLDGSGCSGGCDIQKTCELPLEEQYRCPWAMADLMPMEPGTGCYYKDYGNCRKPGARIDALKKALAALKKDLKAEENEAEGE